MNKFAFHVIETSRALRGMQESPFGVVKLSNTTIEKTLDDSSVVYIGGPSGSQLICFLTG